MEPYEYANMRDALIEAGLAEHVAEKLARRFYKDWTERLDDAYRSTDIVAQTVSKLRAALESIRSNADAQIKWLDEPSAEASASPPATRK